MKILAFDTCLDKMYVTLSENEKILSSKIVVNKDNKYHSAFLISTIREILKKNNINPNDLDAIATNIGPGSFTGIRACTTVARTMAQQLNIPAAGISSLKILEQHAGQNPAVALDARKNCAYFMINGEPKGAVQLEDVENMLGEKKYNLLTDDKLQTRLGGTSYQSCDFPLGETLAKLAFQKLKTEECKWQELKPLYIQPPPMG